MSKATEAEPRIRSAKAGDLTRIKEIAVSAGMFTTEEATFLDEMFSGFLDGSLGGHRWLVSEAADATLLASAQYGPEPFADRMWNFYFLAVDPDHQGFGIGSGLVTQVEADLLALGESQARRLLVETSSTDQYTQARNFYLRLGYVEEAQIRDFYGPGDSKVVFWKALC